MIPATQRQALFAHAERHARDRVGVLLQDERFLTARRVPYFHPYKQDCHFDPAIIVHRGRHPFTERLPILRGRIFCSAATWIREGLPCRLTRRSRRQKQLLGNVV
jgi:hypothetical protein